ncbi:MAG: ErfK/YbiS/YcfS/YnhG [Tardiphaga sp.]|nr:ErfK/YbiS/YcfS/YnhG [Tardiphaga sp.]
MIKQVLTIFATVAVTASGVSLAAGQSYSTPSSGYSIPPDPAYPPGGYPAESRSRAMDAMPDFDALDEDDAQAPRGRSAVALPTPGPIMSPDDPRYGRAPAVAPGPVYSDRAPAPQGPVMSPDDPRYGRPMGPPPVIYSDRPAGGQPQTYSDRGPDDGRGLRPPEAVGPQGGYNTGSVQDRAPGAGMGANGKSVMVAALPPEEQPESDPAQLPPNLRRQEVAFVTKEPPGTIVVDTPNTYLYYVLGNGRAMRYGVRVGRDGFTWTGVQKISRKAEWPDWHPPTEMIERQPYLPRFMAGGPGNPLGARAMYLGSTVYRIHGTNQPSTIGKFVSSGCIGMLNEDVSDLFDRVKVGTRVVVLPGGAPPPSTATASAQPMPGPGGPPVGGPTVVPPLPAPVTVR